MSGRTEKAAKPLDEAMALGKELRNTILTAQTLRLQAERLYYAGDATAAQQLAEQAAQDASKTADKGLSLQAQASAAIAAAELRPTKLNATRLGTLARDADSLGLKALAVETAVHRALLLLKLGDRRQRDRRRIAHWPKPSRSGCVCRRHGRTTFAPSSCVVARMSKRVASSPR